MKNNFYFFKIGVLPGIDSVDNIIVDKLDGIPTMVKDIDELQNLLARGLLTGINRLHEHSISFEFNFLAFSLVMKTTRN